MSQVTVDNFSEKLPEVLAAVDGASFVAIDGEFTGISDNNRCAFFYTSPQSTACLKTNLSTSS